MSYYEADYYRNPVPYTESDAGEPVPGWGVNLPVAGPRRLGVGAISFSSRAIQRAAESGKLKAYPEPPSEEGKPLPWWIWPVSATVLLGVVGFVGTKQGWL